MAKQILQINHSYSMFLFMTVVSISRPLILLQEGLDSSLPDNILTALQLDSDDNSCHQVTGLQQTEELLGENEIDVYGSKLYLLLHFNCLHQHVHLKKLRVWW